MMATLSTPCISAPTPVPPPTPTKFTLPGTHLLYVTVVARYESYLRYETCATLIDSKETRSRCFSKMKVL
ncbi:Uncharacterized protein BM_BM13473 [Brugia malayi]|uniref:Bm13473 n=1 Tax=Brugia malayi TaxID=6279 RepID=A0A0J9XVS2_BRUMA|nr:Uncharacterized protein BM_BM13473 [Brugia malayi]CDP96402.1 Bm13473 [Brugia malayi]VIO98333.1 Uncharacterized protein BM_BM13473 [Brugia malayi]